MLSSVLKKVLTEPVAPSTVLTSPAKTTDTAAAIGPAPSMNTEVFIELDSIVAADGAEGIVGKLNRIELTAENIFASFLVIPRILEEIPIEQRMDMMRNLSTSLFKRLYWMPDTTNPLSEEEIYALIDQHIAVFSNQYGSIHLWLTPVVVNPSQGALLPNLILLSYLHTLTAFFMLEHFKTQLLTTFPSEKVFLSELERDLGYCRKFLSHEKIAVNKLFICPNLLIVDLMDLLIAKRAFSIEVKPQFLPLLKNMRALAEAILEFPLMAYGRALSDLLQKLSEINDFNGLMTYIKANNKFLILFYIHHPQQVQSLLGLLTKDKPEGRIFKIRFELFLSVITQNSSIESSARLLCLLMCYDYFLSSEPTYKEIVAKLIIVAGLAGACVSNYSRLFQYYCENILPKDQRMDVGIALAVFGREVPITPQSQQMISDLFQSMKPDAPLMEGWFQLICHHPNINTKHEALYYQAFSAHILQQCILEPRKIEVLLCCYDELFKQLIPFIEFDIEQIRTKLCIRMNYVANELTLILNTLSGEILKVAFSVAITHAKDRLTMLRAIFKVSVIAAMFEKINVGGQKRLLETLFSDSLFRGYQLDFIPQMANIFANVKKEKPLKYEFEDYANGVRDARIRALYLLMLVVIVSTTTANQEMSESDRRHWMQGLFLILSALYHQYPNSPLVHQLNINIELLNLPTLLAEADRDKLLAIISKPVTITTPKDVAAIKPVKEASQSDTTSTNTPPKAINQKSKKNKRDNKQPLTSLLPDVEPTLSTPEAPAPVAQPLAVANPVVSALNDESKPQPSVEITPKKIPVIKEKDKSRNKSIAVKEEHLSSIVSPVNISEGNLPQTALKPTAKKSNSNVSADLKTGAVSSSTKFTSSTALITKTTYEETKPTIITTVTPKTFNGKQAAQSAVGKAETTVAVSSPQRRGTPNLKMFQPRVAYSQTGISFADVVAGAKKTERSDPAPKNEPIQIAQIPMPAATEMPAARLDSPEISIACAVNADCLLLERENASESISKVSVVKESSSQPLIQMSEVVAEPSMQTASIVDEPLIPPVPPLPSASSISNSESDPTHSLNVQFFQDPGLTYPPPFQQRVLCLLLPFEHWLRIINIYEFPTTFTQYETVKACVANIRRELDLPAVDLRRAGDSQWMWFLSLPPMERMSFEIEWNRNLAQFCQYMLLTNASFKTSPHVPTIEAMLHQLAHCYYKDMKLHLGQNLYDCILAVESRFQPQGIRASVKGSTYYSPQYWSDFDIALIPNESKAITISEEDAKAIGDQLGGTLNLNNIIRPHGKPFVVQTSCLTFRDGAKPLKIDFIVYQRSYGPEEEVELTRESLLSVCAAQWYSDGHACMLPQTSYAIGGLRPVLTLLREINTTEDWANHAGYILKNMIKYPNFQLDPQLSLFFHNYINPLTRFNALKGAFPEDLDNQYIIVSQLLRYLFDRFSIRTDAVIRFILDHQLLRIIFNSLGEAWHSQCELYFRMHFLPAPGSYFPELAGPTFLAMYFLGALVDQPAAVDQIAALTTCFASYQEQHPLKKTIINVEEILRHIPIDTRQWKEKYNEISPTGGGASRLQFEQRSAMNVINLWHLPIQELPRVSHAMTYMMFGTPAAAAASPSTPPQYYPYFG